MKRLSRDDGGNQGNCLNQIQPTQFLQSGNNWGICPSTGIGETGCGPQEEFRSHTFAFVPFLSLRFPLPRSFFSSSFLALSSFHSILFPLHYKMCFETGRVLTLQLPLEVTKSSTVGSLTLDLEMISATLALDGASQIQWGEITCCNRGVGALYLPL